MAPLEERLKSILTRDLQQINLDSFVNLVKLLNKTTTSLSKEARMKSEICKSKFIPVILVYIEYSYLRLVQKSCVLLGSLIVHYN